MSKDQLNSAQKQAVDYLSGPLLVLAGPGTGKTKLLSAKVAHLLTETDTNPENILCITFTEAGAENMRDRLAQVIGRAASKVNIHTYHAFGSDILNQYKNYTPNLSRNLDSPIDPLTQLKILDQIQTKLSALDILKTANLNDLSDTINSAKNARLSAEDLKAIAAHNLQISTKINSELDRLFAPLRPRMPAHSAINQVYQPLLEFLSNFIEEKPIAKNTEAEVNFLVRELNQLLTEANSEKPQLSPFTKWKTANFEFDPAGHYRLKNFISNQKLQSLANIMSAYDQALLQDGLFDFADMIEEAIKILKTDDGFRLTLSEKYQYIMLDEFQDTNPSQFELIRLLTDYESPSIMAVGDDDQAIFAFQGAHASNLLDFQKHYNAKVITLTENYRSTSEILNFSHQIADQITDSFAKNYQTPKILSSVLNQKILDSAKSPAKTHISRHEFNSAPEEYYWVADQIKHLLDLGVPAQEIAVITPKHKYIAPFIPYLKAHPEIKISYEKRENLIEDPYLSQIFLFAEFIYYLKNHQPAEPKLLELLSLPFFEIPPFEILKLAPKNLDLEILASATEPNIQRFLKLTAELLTNTHVPLELFLNYLIGIQPLPSGLISPFLNYYQSTLEPNFLLELYSHLLVLREHLKSSASSTIFTLENFIELITDHRKFNQPIKSTSPYQESDSAMQILTAHKSKGLEFSYVFLIATDDLAWGKAKGNNNLLTLPKNLLHIRHTGITDDERLRLFFVAITRAKLSLTLTGSIKDFSGKTPARLEYLSEAESQSEKGIILSPLLPEPTIKLHQTPLPEDQLATSLTYYWNQHFFPTAPDQKRLLLDKLKNFKLSATTLTSFIDIAYAGPLQFYQNHLLPSISAPDSTLSFGNLIHRSLEFATTSQAQKSQILDFFKETVASEPLSETDKINLLEKGLHSLSVTLDHFSELFSNPLAKAEVDFSKEKIFFENIPLSGKIDHLLIDHQNKTIEVYDFKTGNYHKESWTKHATLFKYLLQLEFYKLLLNHSPTYQNYQVTSGHILFVTPDNNGQVYDKIYQYDPAISKKLKELIPAVFRQIKTLDFLDDPDLALQPDPTRTLKDIRAFIDLLIDKNK